MISVQLGEIKGSREPGTPVYALAGQRFVSDRAIPELAPFQTDLNAGPELSPPLAPWQSSTRLHPIWRGRGWLGSDRPYLTCWRYSEGYQLSVAKVGRFRIAFDGDRIDGELESTAVGDGRLFPTLAGPVFVMTLALREVWCLHAGAVAIEGRVVGFLGRSGTGKSTLAASLPKYGGSSWRPVADDLLPVLQDGSALALPRFPQLKLDPALQWGPDLPERMPLSAFYLLEESKSTQNGGRSPVQVVPLNPRRAALALVRNTFASFLFDGGLLNEHLSFCADVATRVPVFRLVYPRCCEALPEVAQAIAQQLDGV